MLKISPPPYFYSYLSLLVLVKYFSFFIRAFFYAKASLVLENSNIYK